MEYKSFVKDPNSVLDYKWDWSQWLTVSETISSVVITVPDGITEDSHSNTTTAVTVWLSGGSDENNYVVTCKITTNQGRTDERQVTIGVRHR